MQRLPIALLLGTTILGAGCAQEERASYQGYVEGEYLYLAAPAAGYLQTLDRPRGSRVAAGEPLFAIAPDPDADALAEAAARAASAAARVTNLREPRREPEIAALEAALQAEEANLRLARTRLRQQEALAREHFVSQARVDEARSDHDQAAARTESARQQLATYRATLGREAEVKAAEAEHSAADAAVAQRRWVVERMAVAAPAAGEISDTYYRPGEWVAAGSPVASLLPDARRRLRFYVPETALAKLQQGQAVEARCDGCAEPIHATIDFIAPQAEYTPPVIYSRGSREKLVFRVEAAPASEQAATLRPGLPVDVRVLEAR